MERHVVHLEIPNFFATLEQLRDPRLRRVPLVVADPGGRSAVRGANAPARSEGIREGMPVNLARRLCRRICVVTPDFGFYKKQHRFILDRLNRFSPLVEGVFPGCYFVDLTGTRRLWGAPPDAACRLETQLAIHHRIHARVGLAANKLVSRVAAKCVKEGDLGCVFPGGEDVFLRPLPVRMLPGVGLKTAASLADLNIRKIGQLAALSPAMLHPVFGRAGARLLKRARGVDRSPVVPFHRAPRLVVIQVLDQEEDGYSYGVVDRDLLEALLFQQAEEAGWILRSHNRHPGSIQLEISYADGVKVQVRERLREGTPQLDRSLFQAARRLFRRLFTRRMAVRRMALEFTDFAMPYRQLPLFPWDQEQQSREERLQNAVDEIRRRFGRNGVKWGWVADSVSALLQETSRQGVSRKLEWVFRSS